ncbi:MAG: hypothetical protein HQL13_02765 [Candidatus Omnitrophica bacterium]|nr:hypothetical protein [Candidatus Omnitrophota bacterium]
MNNFSITNNTITYSGSLQTTITVDTITVGGDVLGTDTIINTNTNYNGGGIDANNNSGTITNLTVSNNTIGAVKVTPVDNCVKEGPFSGKNTCTETTSTSSTGHGSDSGIALTTITGTLSGVTLSSNNISNFSGTGVNLTYNTGSIAGITFTHNTIFHNAEGVDFNNDAGGAMSNINLGNGATGGYNSIYSNTDYNLINGSGISNLPAEYNWWGSSSPSSSKFSGSSTDYTNPLSSNPN